MCLPKKSFQMHVALLWTINDFFAYGDILGWSTTGAFDVPLVTMIVSLLG